MSVKDTGLDISDDQKQNLFKPFNRLGKENSDIRGAGIGLVITKELIEKMNGNIGVESSSGIGTTFWFSIPISGHHENNTSAGIKYKDSRQALAEENKSILYIEDNESNRSLMSAFLLEEENINLEIGRAHV